MNSVVSKVVGMVATVACLALVLNRPAGAEDPAKPEVKKQAQVVVVHADGKTDIADAVKKALDEKLKGLPKEVQEQVRQKLKGVKVHQPLEIRKALAAKSDAILSAKDGEKKAYAIAIAVDGDDASAKETTKEFKVMIKGGKVFINGKPVTELKDAGKKEIRVEVVADAKPGDKKDVRRRMLFMGKDGKVQEFDFDVNVEQVVVDKADKDADKEGPHAVWIQKHQGLPDDNSKKEIRVRALQLGTGAHATAPHAIHIGQVDKTPADVAKRLKSIESELKKIRQLLQKLQDDDEDDKGIDDKGEDDGEHEHEHAQGHDHEHDE